MAFLLNSQAQG